MQEPAEGITETGGTLKAAGDIESPPKAAGRKHRQAAEEAPAKAPEPSPVETEESAEAGTLH